MALDSNPDFPVTGRCRFKINSRLARLALFWTVAFLPLFAGAEQISTTAQADLSNRSQTENEQEHSQQEHSQQGHRTSVGYVGRINGLVLPGSILVAKPIVNRAQPMVVRVVETYPHGEYFRYDLEFIGYDPGEYNLADYLVRSDGNVAADLPAIPVSVFSQLPAGQVLPSELQPHPSRLLNFYSAALVAGGIVWVLGFMAILFWGRFRFGRPTESQRVLTVADRLRPLVLAAQQGELDSAQRAELERLITAHWRKKLRLEDVPPAQILPLLRSQPEAGELILAVETWLHNPNHVKSTDIDQLLAPFADSVAAEEP